ncbi:MAG: hypothetical protein A2086_14105 [Spirochaetes bacterium GWD1_27_9]|nr:MAG: hypothetical protein A2Z98_14375 [Spirochaetes bacterium GWB1_27_13]OHD22289.1 MAG: hypothetical protein A2Y34_06150 [Spirochaetes bacterium GWC1_27_15]OHD37779.1 MAG: hypothetical protein A2086_14105 [Spirochaetes bacterium GWD1_27_9]
MAISILKEAGCEEIYIFGSIANGDYQNESDIDFAIRGLPEEKYYKICGKLMRNMEHSFDLVDLDEKGNRFSRFIAEKGVFIRVA